MGKRQVIVVLAFLLFVPRALSYIEVYPPVLGENASTKPLFVSLIMSFGIEFNSSHALPGVQLALDRINQDPRMLPGYTLHYTLTDSQVSIIVIPAVLGKQSHQFCSGSHTYSATNPYL